MAETDDFACVYAALILTDDKIAITSDKIATILKAAGVSVEPYWPGLFAKALDGMNLMDIISNIEISPCNVPLAAVVGVPIAPADGDAAAGGGKAAAGGDKAVAEHTKKEEKKKEDSESDEDMGFGLFD